MTYCHFPLVIKHQAVNSSGVFRCKNLSPNVKKAINYDSKTQHWSKKHAIRVGILTREQRCMNDSLPTSFSSCFLLLEHTLLSWKPHTGTRLDTSPVRLDGFHAQHVYVCVCICTNEEEGERGSAQWRWAKLSYCQVVKSSGSAPLGHDSP